MGWKIIEIEQANYLNLFLDNLVIHHQDNKITIQLNDIDVLLINNYKLTVSVQLLNALTAKNILVIFCNNQYIPESILIPIIGNFNTLKIIETQINWKYFFKSNTWKQIISSKIQNQLELIDFLNLNSNTVNELKEMQNNIKEYDITNREGHASKIYWHAQYGQNFKRHDDDFTNMLLNYGYTILRAYFARSIVKKGLDPRISIFHKSFHNYFALASDLMEPLRPIIDYKVYCLVQSNDKNFYNAKQELIQLFNSKIWINNKCQYLNNAIDIIVDSIANQTRFPEIKILYDKLL